MSPRWFRPASRPTSRRGRAETPARSRQLLLEPLEDRLVPAVVAVVTNPVDEYDAYSPVTNNPPVGNDGLLSLREAIRYLDDNGGGSITFGPAFATPQTITLTLGELPVLLQNMTITGPSAGVIINGAGQSRVFEVGNLNHTPAVSIANLTVSGGSANGDGGGILINNGCSLALTNCTLQNNTAAVNGGGLNNNFSTTTSLTNCVLQGNAAKFGGGLTNFGSLALTNCTLQNNTAAAGFALGGGLYTNGTAVLLNCTLQGNSADSNGGGMTLYGTASLTNCTLEGNTSSHGGGGLFVGGTASLAGCTLAFNTANFAGGLDEESGTAALVNCTLFGNAATSTDCGGLLNNQGSVSLTNCTLAGNSTPQRGGGLFNYQGTATLSNTLVAGNTAATGPDLVNNIGFASVTAANCLIGDGSGSGLTNNLNGNQVGGNGNPVLDPLLAPLDYYGGPTKTMALKANSPALTKGDPNAANLPLTDQRGFARTVNGLVDVGAFETQASPFVVTTTADPGQMSGFLSLREAINLANALAGDPTITFDPTVFAAPQKTITLDGFELPVLLQDMAIQGPSAGVTVSGNNQSRIIEIGDLDHGPTISFDKAVYKHGQTGKLQIGNEENYGGAILDHSTGTLSLHNCSFFDDTATEGGGAIAVDISLSVPNTPDPLSLSNCTLSGNSAGGNGGGLFLAAGTSAALSNCMITTNTAGGDGGGLYLATSSGSTPSTSLAGPLAGFNTMGTLGLTNCQVNGNSAGGFHGGGGLYLGGGNSTALANSTVGSNTASLGDGGGIDLAAIFLPAGPLAPLQAGTLGLTNSTVSGNTAHFDGGGLYLNATNAVTLTNSALSGNSAQDGGGLYVAGASLGLTNCTLANNTADFNGGGLARGGGPANGLVLTNCTISGNSIGGGSSSSAAGGGLHEDFGSATLVNTLVAGNTNAGARDDISGSVDFATSFNNLVGDGTGLTGISNGDLHQNQVGSSASPINALLAGLGDYGGPTYTMALLPGSPAIDTGTSGSGAPATDQRGVSRPQVLAFDIGAFESQGFTMTIVSGDNQRVAPNMTLPLPFVVLVTAKDPNGKEPVLGGVVTFQAPNSGPSGTFPGPFLTATAMIAADGTATSPLLTTNGIQGAFTVSASASGANTVYFHVTNAIAAVINGNLVVVGTNGNDNITVTYANNAFSVYVNGKTLPFSVGPNAGQVSSAGHVIIYGLDTTPTGTDNLTMSGKFPAEIHAGNGRTIVHGGTGGDVIYGGALATSVLTAYAGTGADVIVGGPGTAKMYAGSGGKAVLIGGSLKAGMGFDTYASLATLANQWAGGTAAQIATQLTALTAAFQAGVSDTLTATGGAATWGVASAAATFNGFALPPTGHDKKTAL